jgi:hypothetical protein
MVNSIELELLHYFTLENMVSKQLSAEEYLHS